MTLTVAARELMGRREEVEGHYNTVTPPKTPT